MEPMLRTRYLCILPVLLITPLAGAAPGDLDALLAGVNSIAAPGVPGPLAVFGPDAFPVIVGKSGGSTSAAVVAATRLGKGRVTVFGHDGYLARETLAIADTDKLFSNAILWTAGSGKPRPRIGILHNARLADHLRKSDCDTVSLETRNWPDSLPTLDLVIANSAQFHDSQLPAIRRFIENGGGLIAGSLGWGWSQLNPGKSLLTDHPGNCLLAPAGLVWADGTLDRTAKDGYDSTARPSPLIHAARAVTELATAATGKATLPSDSLAQAGASVTLAAQSLPASDTLLVPRLNKLVDGLAPAYPTPSKSLKAAADPLSRLAITLWYLRSARLTPDAIQAHPAAEAFPGAVPAAAPRVRRTVTIDLSVPGWHSTGLYAPPGQSIVVRLPAGAAKSALLLRIGAHRDELWDLDSWRRMPRITSSVSLASPTTHTVSPFGGLIYVDNARPQPGQTVSVDIDSAVEAPLFVLGKTTNDQWKALRNSPGPWAEIQATQVILTVPSEHVRKLDDPPALAGFWDRVLDACADLAAIPRQRPRPERYVADVQISAGYMHSGYPIMTHLDVADLMLDRQAMLAVTREPVWGLFHEMGHNHQSPLWTFDGAGEVTCNLFSRYCLETVCGLPTDKHGKSNPQAVDAYLKSGGDWNRWKSDPFLALAMYDQLKAGFGWETYKKVFAEYQQLPRDQCPRSDQDKRDQWVIRFSKASGKNLAPFFTAWGMLVTEGAKQSVKDLPVWFPEGFPGQRGN